ncbi:MAG: acetyl-CoA carboxylase biotin carboxylase subunit [Elusimicrobia bacterium]|jgi:acetyl-CoA carboxylase biotin carboxylase subunit|nr:acetyl-CoA carboxylase biotin carboxylase subunit [Elusimicrobiota bacterium]MBK7208308.1 acetyl-CoA carboxylase biotin carboxylase subunit [Elusimicrobiota bacterium]MBK7545069.1 acetyl-CoA carboxylase biotin carboxylase subunit [Elusimicrobiota bacterium]MBK7574588.1 acetyl-CoA carboxylase biotin carboxylase subunit [Elusimicrobiota bacterium]MBK7688044.1 acetyl-CoA carboxylase biotin carboxylase subunit [Elusimicrobiota bacterium]
MFKKILIANRGEIAVRVIRACRELGIKTVAVHSDIDRSSMHVRHADESVCIGAAPAAESYLNIPAIISAAEITGADAIHPGYGFLSENTHFAEVCESCHITFIGPSKDAIRKMGDKAEARKIMGDYGVPIIPGTKGCVDINDKELMKTARKIGFPLLVKAKAGGGGKGMRVVQDAHFLKDAILAAQNEAKAAFGNGDVYMERYLNAPRHIEVQILGDAHGKVISFPERDCSVQRRHQKLIEESPSSSISDTIRKKMGKAARLAAKAVKYQTVGTVEFLYDEKTDDFFFIEMNTRIQVEHPVTEMVTGIDLIKEQIRTAAGEKIPFDAEDVQIKHHALECRINAEDPERNFMPSPGKITNLILPGGPGVRVDTHVYPGYTIPSYYDSLMAKLIVAGRVGPGGGRESVIRRMARALDEFVVEGVKTTIPFHRDVMANEAFLRGDVKTDFIEKHLALQPVH